MTVKLRLSLMATAVTIVVVALVALLWRHQHGSEHPDTARFLARQPGQTLAAGFVSYASVADARASLAEKQLSVDQRTLARPLDSRYPPHALDTLTVEHFALLGTQGRLSLQFFNDRLFEVDYKPDDIAACARAIRRDDPELHRDANGRAEQVDGDRRVATNIELAASAVGQSLKTEPYVVWQDLRLVRDRDEWDERFGALPYKMP